MSPATKNLIFASGEEAASFLQRMYGIDLAPERARELAASAARLCAVVEDARAAVDTLDEPGRFIVAQCLMGKRDKSLR